MDTNFQKNLWHTAKTGNSIQGIPTNRLDELIIQINKLIDAHNEYIDDPRIDYNSPKDGILSLTKNELEKYYSFDFDKRCSDFCHFLFLILKVIV